MFIIYDVLQSWNVWWHSQRFWCTTPSRPFPICDWMHSIICFNLSQGDSGATGPQGLPGAPGKTVQYEFFLLSFFSLQLVQITFWNFCLLVPIFKMFIYLYKPRNQTLQYVKNNYGKKTSFFFCWILQQHILTNFYTFTRNS